MDKNILPADFDGVFRFTNFTDQEFKAKWDNIEYTFPPLKTTPLIIPGATPEQVQNIRKKFAKELGVQEFYRSQKFKSMEGAVRTPSGEPTGGTPSLYTDSDIAPFVQRCLEALPIAQAKAKVLPKDSEDNYRKDKKGKNVSRILDGDEKLLENDSSQVA